MATYAIGYDISLTKVIEIEAEDEFDAMDIAERLIETGYKKSVIYDLASQLDENPYIETVYLGKGYTTTLTADEINEFLGESK